MTVSSNERGAVATVVTVPIDLQHSFAHGRKGRLTVTEME